MTKNFSIMLLALVFTSQPGWAALYKQVDEQGNVTYTDAPGKSGGEIIEPEPLTTIDSATTPTLPSESGAESSEGVIHREDIPATRNTQYSMVEITEPVDDATIRANGGIIAVNIVSTPVLDAQALHRVVVMLDGQRHQESPTTRFEVANLERGTHSLTVQIEDSHGNVLISSNPVTVHIQKFSVLHPRP